MLGKIGLLLESTPMDMHRSFVLLAIAVVKSFWPISRSAGCSILVGIEFQISTRLKPRSDTYSRTPSLETPTGFNIVVAEAVSELFVRSRFGTVVKFFCPSTRSAG